MKIPFANDKNKPFVSVEFGFSGEAIGSGTIAVTSEGAGAFVEIKSDDVIRMDPHDLLFWAVWAEDACLEIDAFNGETPEGDDNDQ